MLDPRNRQLLLESLRPPEGYKLDRAIGTSYSLDLLALLTAPLAFTFFNWEDDEGRPAGDPLALLESIRRHADRIRLFCQAGEIKLPPPSQRLVGYLEQCVVPARAPSDGGIFHPKVWLVRFLAEGSPVLYRLLCLTRNLTFDRSWDSILTLDGTLLDRKLAVGASRPIGDFIAALPKMAIRPMSEPDQAWMAEVAEEVRRVRFEPPDGVDELRFWPIGLSQKASWIFPKEREDRPLLVMAPFLSAGFLRRLTERRSSCVLVSRPDQLAAMPVDLMKRFKAIYYIDPGAEDAEEDRESSPGRSTAGLHAKLFIEDDGWNAHVYTGSANATDAAFRRNVEFVAELEGKKANLGISRCLGEEGSEGPGLSKILRPWTGAPIEKLPEAKLQDQLEKRLAEARRTFAARPLLLNCVRVEGGEELYKLELWAKEKALIGFPEVVCWLASMRRETGVAVSDGPGVIASFGPLSLDAVSGFLACEIAVSEGGQRVASTFVVNVPLEGAPSDRLQRLLVSQLKDKEQLLRLLWLLLQAEGSAGDLAGVLPSGAESATGKSWSSESPIFERLVRSLVESRERVTEVGRLIDDLSRSPEGRALIPASLLQLWGEMKTCLGDRDERSGPT